MSSDEYSFKAFSEHAFYRKVNEALVDRAELKRGWTVVDVACGSGAITELILEKIRGAREAMVIGVDMSTTALRDAAEKVAGARDAVVEFVQSRAEDLIEDKHGLLEEVYRTLKPGGVFAFNTGFFDGAIPPETLTYYRRWMIKALRRLRKEYNLKPEHSKVESRKQLTAEAYRALLEAKGFEIRSQEICLGEVTEEGWVDLSRFSDFIAGALPGIPLKTASDVLVETMHETFEEFNLTVWPRNWLNVVAARP
jgi:ubiquinone/menaquinone biosynthesis C-methylase UbiE